MRGGVFHKVRVAFSFPPELPLACSVGVAILGQLTAADVF